MGKVRSVDLGSSFLPSIEGACEIVLVRHGEQEFSTEGSLDHNRDAPLSDLGVKQAEAVAERLSSWEIDAVHSSPMQRAHDTGLAIARHHGHDVALHAMIEEIDIWKGFDQDLTLLEATGGEGPLREILREANRTRRYDAYPDGEDRVAFRQRVVSTIDSIAATHEGQRIVVTCHGGVINAYLAHVMQSDLDTICTVHHTSITTIRAMDDLRRVVQINDFEHVRPLQTSINPINAA
ncbi:MAG: histidine phosphatase family protein [Acidimicrobiales bacterium]|jgi:probable phosphoglycerate mutase|nr:histidine phosphatase family protein [Acidimicrobiales bacterium]